MLFEEKSTSTNYSGRSAFFNHARSILTPLPFGSGPHHPCAASLRSDEPRRRVSQRVSRAYNTRVPPTFTSRLLLAPTQSSQPCSCSFDLTLALSLSLSVSLSLSLSLAFCLRRDRRAPLAKSSLSLPPLPPPAVSPASKNPSYAACTSALFRTSDFHQRQQSATMCVRALALPALPSEYHIWSKTKRYASLATLLIGLDPERSYYLKSLGCSITIPFQFV